MKNSSNQLTVRSDRPVDAVTIEVLRILDGELRHLECLYMVVGATARDILLLNVFGKPVMRATKDIDYAIAVESWDKFSAVKDQILRNPGFTEDSKIVHRLAYKSSAIATTIPIDIIPFGKVADPEGKIAWPPDADFAMTVVGFEEALNASIDVRVTDDLVVNVVSLAGLTILKLLAWMDRRSDKDATDIYRILQNYADSGNVDRLYEELQHLLKEAEFNLELAGAKLLGLDVALICNATTRAKLTVLINDEKMLEHLASQIDHQIDQFGDAHGNAAIYLDAFVLGFSGI